MDPDKIELENLSKNFEYFKASTEIDGIDDIEQLKKQEVLSSLDFISTNET